MHRYRTLIVCWLLSDVILFLAGYAAAYGLRIGPILSTDHPFDQHMTAAIITVPIWLACLLTTRCFALNRNQQSWRSLAYVTYSAAIGIATFALSYYFLYGAFFSRLLLIYAFILTSIGIWIWHIIFERFKRCALRRPPIVFPTVIVGVTRESRKLITLLNDRLHPLTPVAVLDARGCKDKEIEGVPFKGKLNKLDDTLAEGATHLIQCHCLEQSLNILQTCRQKQISYTALPSLFGIVEGDERIETIENVPVTVVRPKESILGWFFR